MPRMIEAPVEYGDPGWMPIYGGGVGAQAESVSTKQLAHDYLSMMMALLPRGKAWEQGIVLGEEEIPQPDTLLGVLLLGFCHELERVDGRTDDLMNEKLPATTYELLTDWERVCGIPDACSGITGTVEERREVVSMKVAQRGGQSVQYFLDLAEYLGWTGITITEFEPCMMGVAHCNSPLATSSENVDDDEEPGEGWVHVWAVENFGQKVIWFRSGSSSSGDSISVEETEDNRLTCFFNLLKPAHTRVIYPPAAP